MTVTVLRADARQLPLPDNSVDLVVTSPPYFGLRSYTDGGVHYEGQVGSEATPAEFVAALLDVTRECVRVLKPSGSLWVNLGDKYASAGGHGKQGETSQRQVRKSVGEWTGRSERNQTGVPTKSLIGIPWRYALACIDDLGLILRANVIWNKPNGLPESVTDRVRRSHEDWFHFTLQPRYYSAVDEIREPQTTAHIQKQNAPQRPMDRKVFNKQGLHDYVNPLGKLPGSVWEVPTEPLQVPEHLGVDHFAAFPSEFPRRIITGWSPPGVCVECGEGRRPVVTKVLGDPTWQRVNNNNGPRTKARVEESKRDRGLLAYEPETRGSFYGGVTGYACACPQPDAPTRPSVILDPFGGTGTVAHVAHALGRHGISIDLSADYCRLAAAPELRDHRWRKIHGGVKPEPQIEGQGELFGGDAA